MAVLGLRTHEIGLAVVINTTARRTGQFPGAGPVVQVAPRLRWDRIYSEDYVIAALCVLASDTEFPLRGHDLTMFHVSEDGPG
jgi:hypothetical protein